MFCYSLHKYWNCTIEYIIIYPQKTPQLLWTLMALIKSKFQFSWNWSLICKRSSFYSISLCFQPWLWNPQICNNKWKGQCSCWKCWEPGWSCKGGTGHCASVPFGIQSSGESGWCCWEQSTPQRPIEPKQWFWLHGRIASRSGWELAGQRNCRTQWGKRGQQIRQQRGSQSKGRRNLLVHPWAEHHGTWWCWVL